MTAPQDGADNNAPEETVSGDDLTADGARVRFKGIVEADAAGGRAAATPHPQHFNFISHDERRWNAMSRQVWQVSRLTAIFVFFSFIVGLPLGNWIAHLDLNGSSAGWNPLAAYEIDTFLFAFVVPALIYLMGYMLSRAMTMMNAAESIAAAAQQIVSPDAAAARNAESVGAVVRSQMDSLNTGLDGALTRLASVEAMIRQHVEAIELAGDAIEHKATNAVARVADERSRLMELTESLNAHADSFAAAIAERANASIESLQSAENISLRVEQEFEARLTRLEDAAARALGSFESLRDALRDTDETIRAGTDAISAASEETVRATVRAQAASDAAADAAARNAANVSASAARAAETAKKATQAAIDSAASEAERIASEAIDAAAREGAKVQDAAAATLEEIAKNTADAVGAAVDDAARATKAAEDVSEAARKTSEAAAKASSDVVAASEQARASSNQALEVSAAQAERMEERNRALADARAALEHENERLETLIEEQRKRADRLADAIASQTERLSRLAEAQLREQEAAVRLTQAQNEIQAQADKDAAARRRKEAEAAEARAQAAAEAARRAAAPPPQKSQAQKSQGAKTHAPEKPASPRTAAPRSSARLDELARDIAERRPQRKQQGPQEGAPSAQRNGASAQRRREPPITSGTAQGAGEQPPADKTRRRKKDVSWREILDAAEDAEPLELGESVKENGDGAPQQNNGRQNNGRQANGEENAIRTISRLQQFTYDLETRLYGDPPPALQERFDRGDRNVFANRLLRLNEADVKRRIRMESGRDKTFERGVNEFLQGFESLLEDATTSETADEELEEYLSSPLGRVYLLIGATVGYFA